MDEYYNLPWEEDNNSDDDEHALLNRWFGSPAWSGICDNAESGDTDSLQLMEEVSDQLVSLIFHLNNGSDEPRIQYELNYFSTLCEDFGVA